MPRPEPKFPSAEELARDTSFLTPAALDHVGAGVEDLAALLLLESVRGFGPQKFKELHEQGLAPIDVLRQPGRLPIGGKRGETFRQAISEISPHDRELAHVRAIRQLARAIEHGARVVTYTHPAYPRCVYESNNPVPILYVRGDLQLLNAQRSVACVGSRETAPPYSDLHRAFAGHAARSGFLISSGFALGADTIGHRAAVESAGATVMVMPCGLDRPFPPENRELWSELAHYRGALAVSEFPFGTAASGLTLRKRNKLIVAFAQGVLVSQSSAKGGAMNAYRFAIEQRKRVATFAPDGSPRTSGNLAMAHDEDVRQTSLAGGAPPMVWVFPPYPDELAWDSWLRELSSST
jgi:DNA processing protein